MNPLLILAGFVAVAVTAILLSMLYERKRTRALQAIAASCKFSFSAKLAEVPPELGLFHLFLQGHGKRVTNVMHGNANDIDVTIMDYQYTTGGGKNSHTWRQTVIAFRSPLLTLPAFTLRPETVFHKIGAVFGYQDIDFVQHPAFSKRYLLQGSDEEGIRALFTDALLSFYDKSRGLCTEGDEDALIFYRPSKRVPPKEIMTFMQEGFTVFGLMKGGAAS